MAERAPARGGVRAARPSHPAERSITKAPTAELRPNQTDQDSLPPYDELDAILGRLVEEELSVADICGAGGLPARHRHAGAGADILGEYKRRQAPPGRV